MTPRIYRLFEQLTLGVFLILALGSCSSERDENPTGELTALDLSDQSYGPNSTQLLDVYLPAGRSIEKTPLLIYIHGGAWIEGSKDEFKQFKNSLSSAFPEYAFVSINYSLYNLANGTNKFPTQENDVIEAISYVVSKTDEWNISDTIILAGASAGGHLALLHAYKHKPFGNIKAVVAFFPPTDLAELYDFSFLTVTGLGGLLGGNPGERPEAYAASSPITFVDSQSVPTIFFHGTDDTVVPISQSFLLEKALTEADVAHNFIIVPNQGHGFALQTYPSLFQQAAIFINEL
ncbi:alpha/beta hydrolase [Algoriphagus winogradskyi]|uniref:Acetyl esterase/lipase n=1 Tax=Algoriphagus winogradskyi TaxID=237017 RepID=A0ABY1P6L8_9BACT|nr:alpha/beta hydrolase [Algoriphagus winogradskyi]SMP27769.1 Acetyl esterase/lipase [Algoriphagus winogradskyi]